MKRMIIMVLLVLELVCLLWGCQPYTTNDCAGSPGPDEMSEQAAAQSKSESAKETRSARSLHGQHQPPGTSACAAGVYGKSG